MKKVMSLVLLMIISFTLTACDGLIDNTPENEAPEVIGDSYIIFQKGSPEPDWRDYADATDPEDGAIRITNAMIDTNDLDMNKEGIYEVDIYVTDSDGKSSLFVITVQIQDDRDVELTLIGDEEITIEVGEVYDELGAVARYVGAENIDYTINGTVDTNVLGSYVIEYVVEVKDLKIARLVHVVDNQSPMITLGDFMHVYVLKDSEYNDFPLYIEDNYDVELNTTMMGYPNTAVEGVYEIEYQSTDSSGNVSEVVTRYVHVVAGTIPIFIYDGEQTQTYEFGEMDSYETLEALVFLDDGIHTMNLVEELELNVVGTQTLNYVYIDNNDITYQYTVTINIVDTVNPELVLLGGDEVTIEFGAIFIDPVAVATDNYDEIVEVLVDGVIDFDTVGEYVITYSAVDSSGNEAVSVTRTVTIVDTESPVLSVNGDKQYVTLNGEYTDLGATVTDNYDSSISIIIDNPVDPSVLGEYIVTYTATDSSGNETVATRTVLVVEGVLNQGNLIGASEVYVEYQGEYDELGAIAMFDYGIFDMTVNSAVNVNALGTYTVTYNYVDADEVVYETIRTVYVVDTTIPSIVLTNDEAITLELNQEYQEYGASVYDNHDTSFILKIDDTNIDISVVGTYEVTYNVTDSSGNNADTITRTVHVVDSDAPVITLKGTDTHFVSLNGTYNEYGVDITDNYYVDGFEITTLGTIDVTTVGEYTLTYTVMDLSGNVSNELSRVVYVIDNDLPYMNLLGDDTLYVEYLEDYTHINATITLDYGNYAMDRSGSVNTSVLGTYYITYSYTDVFDVYHELIRTVYVEDTTAPVITLTGEDSVDVEVHTTFNDSGATAEDNYDTDLTVTIDDSNVNYDVLGTYTITYDVADAATNAATTVTRTINIVDNTAPTITLAGLEDHYVAINTSYDDLGVTIEDNYYSDGFTTVVDNPVDVTVPGEYVITYTVTDPSNNQSNELTRTVHVIDGVLPMYVYEGELEINLEHGNAYTEQGVKILLESGFFDMTVTGTVDNSTLGVYTVTYTFTDSVGTDYEVIRTVTIQDNTAPVLTIIGEDELTLEYGTAYEELGVSVVESFDGNLNVVVVDDIDLTTVGTYYVTYNATDVNGNVATEVVRTVHVVDTTSPVITLEGYSNFFITVNDTYTEVGVSFTDNYDTTFTMDTVGVVDMSTVGEYVLTYTVTDSSGNVSNELTRTVNVIEQTLEVGQVNGSDEMTLEYQDEYSELGALIAFSDGIYEMTLNGSVDTTILGDYVIEYSYIDNQNTEYKVVRTVHVVDSTKPVITLIGDSEIYVEVFSTYQDLGATTIDNYDSTFMLRINNSTLDMDTVGSYIVYYDVTDSNGNKAVTVERVVHVVDTTAPEITLNGESNFDLVFGYEYVEEGFSYTDNYDIALSVDESGTIDHTVEGEQCITYTVSDSSGNSTSVDRCANVVFIAPTVTDVNIVFNGTSYEVTGTLVDPQNRVLDISHFNTNEYETLIDSVSIDGTTLYTVVSDIMYDADVTFEYFISYYYDGVTEMTNTSGTNTFKTLPNNIAVSNMWISKDYILKGNTFVINLTIDNPSNIDVDGVYLNNVYYDNFLPGSSNTYLFIKLNTTDFNGLVEFDLNGIVFNSTDIQIMQTVQDVSTEIYVLEEITDVTLDFTYEYVVNGEINKAVITFDKAPELFITTIRLGYNEFTINSFENTVEIDFATYGYSGRNVQTLERIDYTYNDFSFSSYVDVSDVFYAGEEVIHISTALQLQQEAYECTVGYCNNIYIIDNDIDMTDVEFNGFGATGYPFTGYIDGQGHTISNLSMEVIEDTSDDVYAGFVNYSNNAIIKNIVLDNASLITKNVFSSEHTVKTGLLIGFSYNDFVHDVMIMNSTIDGYSNGRLHIGGAIGATMFSKIDNMFVDVNIVANSQDQTKVGGLIGFSENNIVNNIEVQSTISSNDAVISSYGAIVGYTLNSQYSLISASSVQSSSSATFSAFGYAYNVDATDIVANGTMNDVMYLNVFDSDTTKLYSATNIDYTIIDQFTADGFLIDESFDKDVWEYDEANSHPKLQDILSPIVSLVGGNNILVLLDSEFVDLGVTAFDNKSTAVSIEVDSNVDTSIEGIYYVTYTVTDDAGNEKVITRKVVVSNTIEYRHESLYFKDSVTAGDYIVVVGQFNESNPFGLQTNGMVDAFVAVFDLDMNLQWADNIGWADYDYAQNVLFDGEFIYVIGTTHEPALQDQDVFINKYSLSGELIDEMSFGGEWQESVFDAFINSNNEIVLMGRSNSTQDDFAVRSGSHYEVYIAEISLDLTVNDLYIHISADNVYVNSIIENGDGNYVFTGSSYFSGVNAGFIMIVDISTDTIVDYNWITGNSFIDVYQNEDGTYYTTTSINEEVYVNGQYLWGSGIVYQFDANLDLIETINLSSNGITNAYKIVRLSDGVLYVMGSEMYGAMDRTCLVELELEYSGCEYYYTQSNDGIHAYNISTVTSGERDYFFGNTYGEELVNGYWSWFNGQFIYISDIAEKVNIIGGSEINHEVGTEYIDLGAEINYYYQETIFDISVSSNIDVTTVGSYEVIYSALDVDGYVIETFVRTVHVVDTVAPVIELIDTETQYVTIGGEYTEFGAIFSDNYNDNEDLVFMIEGEVDTSIISMYVIQYTVQDASNNLSQVLTRIVYVIAEDIPNIYVEGGFDVSIEYNYGYQHEEAYIILSYGVFMMNRSGEIDTTTLGEQFISYEYTDRDGVVHFAERKVTVVDTTIPVIELIESDVLYIEVFDSYEEYGALVYDNYDTELQLAINHEINTSVLGEYFVMYGAVDSNGNGADPVARLVHVVDTTSPEITFNSTANYYVTLNGEYIEPGVMITDNYYSGLEVVITGTVDTSTIGDYELTYVVTDPSGNESVTLTRIVHVVDRQIPFTIINGDAEFTLEYQEDYIDLGAQLVVPDGVFDMVTTDTVDTNVLGTHTITYTYSYDVGYTITKTVHVVDTTPPTLDYSGETEITLFINQEYTIPEITANDNFNSCYQEEQTILEFMETDPNAVNWSMLETCNALNELNVNVFSDLDLTSTGTYTAIYNATDHNGNDAQEIVITYHVIYRTPELDLTISQITNNSIEVNFDFTDTDAVTYDFRLELQSIDDVLHMVEPIVGLNEYVFTDRLQELTDYTIVITGSYDLHDGNGVQYITFYEEVISTRETLIPEYSVISDERTSDTITINFQLQDMDGTLLDSYLVLYQNGTEVERKLYDLGTSEYSFLGLTDATDYVLQFDFNYDLQRGTGAVNEIISLYNPIYTLPLGPPITSFTAETNDSYLGDLIPFVLQIENTSNLEVYSIIVNGIEITNFIEPSNNSLLIFNMESGDVAGTVGFSVEAINVYYNGELYTYAVSENGTVDVKIFREIEVLDIVPTDGEVAVERYTEKMITVTFDNPEGYTIESVTINGTKYLAVDFITASAESIVLNVTVPCCDGVRRLEVNSVEYGDGETTKEASVYEGNLAVTALYSYGTLNINYINTVEDLQNMGQDGYYVLNADLDLSGINWTPLSSFNGYFDGNGHVISGLTIEEITNNTDDRRYGLFERNNGYITNLGLEELSINILSLNSGSHTYYVGGISGENRGIIVRSYVVGKIHVENTPYVIVGGISGTGYNGIIKEVYTKGEMIINAKYYAYVGGIFGESKTTISNSYSEMDIQVNSGDYAYVGGISGQIGSGKVDNVYFTGEINLESSGIYGAIGGYFNNTSLNNVFGLGYYLFGEIGDMTVKNTYLIGESRSINGYYSQYRSYFEITGFDSLAELDFSLLGWQESVWDFTTETPTLIALDNTPTYTAQ